MPAPIPANEEQRLTDLYLYDIMDTEAEKDFDDLASLAASICNCSMATITFIDKDRQWFKARKNVPHAGGSREDSFCAHAITEVNEVMVVMDSAKDHRFYDNPNVTDGLKIQFYAGAPIISPTGFPLGTICAMDDSPKMTLDPKQVDALRVIARQISQLLDLRLKNKHLEETGAALLEAQRKLAQQNLRSRDDENLFIATELHENFAQILAAVKMQLDLAEKDQEYNPDSIRTSKQLINDLVNEMRVLSKTITPTTFENANYADLIEAHIIQYSSDNKLDIEYNDGRNTQLRGAFGLSIFRLIELYLKMVQHLGASKVMIHLQSNGTICITLFDNAPQNAENTKERKLYLDNMHTRIDMLGGTMRQHSTPDEGTVMLVALPNGKD